MARYSFNRKYELIISKPFTQTFDNPTEDYRNTPLENDIIVFKGSNDYRQINKKKSVTLDALHFTAEITGSNTSSSSGSSGRTATIKIYNLSEDSRSLIENVNNYIVLNAGYEDDSASLPMLYSGQVVSVDTEFQGEDLVTTLMCKDGYTPSNAIRISYGAMAGSTYADVIRDFANFWRQNGVTYTQSSLVLDQSAVPLPVIESPPSDTTLERTYTFSGFLRKAMDEVCDMFNLTWYIINNTLHVHPIYYRKMIATVEVGSNQIISVKSSQNGTGTTSSDTTEKGIIITLLLDGRITNNKLLKILDTERSGTYKINAVSHSLSYEGQNWYTKVECIPV